MKRFIDATGKQWEIDVHLESIERVKSSRGIDLTKLFADEMRLINQLSEDHATLAEVLWELQTSPGADRSEFIRGLRGDALEAGFKALLDDVIDFFPNSRQRKICRETVEKLWQTVEAVQSQAETELAKFDPTSLLSATGSAESQASHHTGSD